MADSRFSALVEALAELSARFDAGDWKIYAVGGSVRDCLDVGDDSIRTPDIDLTTDAPPEVTERLLDPWADVMWTQGKRFGTIGARRGSVDVEVTTHRREEYDSDSRKPVVRYGAATDGRELELADDLSRRDFTINAMAVPLAGPEAGTLIDPHGGEADLAARVLRTPLAPEVAFDDDPLRMLRAARFMASRNVRPEQRLVDAATTMAARLPIISAERIRDELCKLLTAGDPMAGLEFLEQTGLMAFVIPELSGRADDATFEMAQAGGTSCGLCLAGLLFDRPPKTLRHRAEELRMPGDEAQLAVSVHRAAHALLKIGSITPEALRAWAADGFEVRQPSFTLSRMWAERFEPSSVATLDRLDAELSRLSGAEDLSDLGAELSGDEIMQHLGLEPGRVVGEAVEAMRRVRITQGPLTPDDRLSALDRWWAARGENQ